MGTQYVIEKNWTENEVKQREKTNLEGIKKKRLEGNKLLTNKNIKKQKL